MRQASKSAERMTTREALGFGAIAVGEGTSSGRRSRHPDESLHSHIARHARGFFLCPMRPRPRVISLRRRNVLVGQHEKRAVHPHCCVLPALPCATQRFRHTKDARGTAERWPGSDAALQGTCRWRQGKSSSWDPIDSSVGRSHPRARDGQSCAQDQGSA